MAALCNLTSQLAENKRAICEAGGLEMAVAALMAHPQSQEKTFARSRLFSVDV